MHRRRREVIFKGQTDFSWMKGASCASLPWQLISQTYRLHKVAYWKHVPLDQSTPLVIFMVYSYCPSPPGGLIPPVILVPINATARATYIWAGEVCIPPFLFDEHSSHVTQKKTIQKKLWVCSHTKDCCTNRTQSAILTHSYIHTLTGNEWTVMWINADSILNAIFSDS